MAEKKKYRNDENNDLAAILEQYPQIDLKSVYKFLPIYYPIAIVNVRSLNRSMEDFEYIELVILRMIQCKVNKPEWIAELLGLNIKFVNGIIKLLFGYGHITKQLMITDLGKESINSMKKIEYKEGIQQFQVNTFNGRILRADEIISNNQIESKEETRFHVAHLVPSEQLPKDVIEQQLKGSLYQNFIQCAKDKIVNLEQIVDMHVKDVCFAYSYLLGIKECGTLIFTKRYNNKSKKNSFFFEMLSVPNPTLYSAWNIKKSIPLQTSEEMKAMNTCVQLLENEALQIKEKDYEDAILKTYEYNMGAVEKLPSKLGCKVYVTKEAFHIYNPKMYRILKNFNTNGFYLATFDKLYGRVVQVFHNDEDIKKTYELLGNRIAEYGERNLRKRLLDHFEDYEQQNIIDELYSFLETM